jgi:hypothetical protein
MKNDISFLRRRHASLFRAVENLEHNFNMLHDFQDLPVVECLAINSRRGRWQRCRFKEIQDRIEEAISEVKAIRTAIEDRISVLEAAS